MMLVDQEAIDVARMTGVGWYYARLHQRGPLHPVIDLRALDWWERWTVAWCRIGAYHLIQHG